MSKLFAEYSKGSIKDNGCMIELTYSWFMTILTAIRNNVTFDYKIKKPSTLH